MNAIQTRDRVLFYANKTKTQRFYPDQIAMAVMDNIFVFIDQQFEGERYSFQLIEKVRTRLYTLIKEASLTISAGQTISSGGTSFKEETAPWPADYLKFVAVWPTIDSDVNYARPMNYNMRGPLLRNPFAKPTNDKVYFNENAAGLLFTRAATGTMTAKLEYLKTPSTFSLGAESQYLITGASLTAPLVYIATEETVYNGATYLSGAEITASGVNTITSGGAILKANTTAVDLPVQAHEIVAKMAAQTLLAVSGNLQSSMVVSNEVNKNN